MFRKNDEKGCGRQRRKQQQRQQQQQQNHQRQSSLLSSSSKLTTSNNNNDITNDSTITTTTTTTSGGGSGRSGGGSGNNSKRILKLRNRQQSGCGFYYYYFYYYLKKKNHHRHHHQGNNSMIIIIWGIIFLFSIVLILTCWWLWYPPLAAIPRLSTTSTKTATKTISSTNTTTSSSSYAIEQAQEVYGTYIIWDDTIEAVYALPSSTTKAANNINIKGIVLLLHACTHNALKFFSPSTSSCPNCIGLSEEIRISKLCLQRGYAVLAISCIDKQSGCWSNQDLPYIKIAINKFIYDIIIPSSFKRNNQQRQQHGSGSGASNIHDEQQEKNDNDELELLALSLKQNMIVIGASSGGSMAAKVVADNSIEASNAIIMVMGLNKPIEEKLINYNVANSNNNIALYLAPMPRDKGTTQRTKQNYENLLRNDNKISNIILDTTTCVPFPVTPTYLFERVPFMTMREAQTIVQGLIQAKHLSDDNENNNNNTKGGMLIKDPTKSNWRDILQGIPNPSEDPKYNNNNGIGDINQNNKNNSNNKDYLWDKFLLTPGKSTLAKSLHRAWAFHEYCSEVVEPAIDFFESIKTKAKQQQQQQQQNIIMEEG